MNTLIERLSRLSVRQATVADHELVKEAINELLRLELTVCKMGEDMIRLQDAMRVAAEDAGG